MPLIDLIIVLIFIGVALYLIDFIPMDGTIKRIIKIVIIVALVLWVIQAFGLLEPLRQYRIGRP